MRFRHVKEIQRKTAAPIERPFLIFKPLERDDFSSNRHPALVPLPCRGLELGSRRYLLGLAHRKARAARQRERRPFAVASRCNFGEPMQLQLRVMQLQLWVRIFCLQSR